MDLTNSQVITQDQAISQLKRKHSDEIKLLQSKQINPHLHQIAELIINHPSKPIITNLRKLDDVQDLLIHILSDKYNTNQISTNANYNINQINDCIYDSITDQSIKIVYNVKHSMKKAPNFINLRCPVQDTPYLLPGGFVEYKLTNDKFSPAMNVNYFTHDSKITNKLNISTMYYFNQNPTISSGHIDGDCGYLYLQSGLKLWIQVP